MPAPDGDDKTSSHRPAWLCLGDRYSSPAPGCGSRLGPYQPRLIPAPAFTETPSTVASPVLSATQQPTETSQPTAIPTATSIPTATPGIGSTWISPINDSVMVYVPEGSFTMGSNVTVIRNLFIL